MLTHKGSANIETERLLLRPFREGDEEMMFKNWASDDEVTRYLSWNTHADISFSRRVVCEWSAAYGSPTVYHWGITLQGELIGDIAVVQWNQAQEWAEIGYAMGRKWWGCGIMTEALRAVMNYLFQEIGFHRIQLRHDVKNHRSRRVMEKCGMTYEGTQRGEEKRKDGSWADVAVLSILRDEWEQAGAPLKE